MFKEIKNGLKENGVCNAMYAGYGDVLCCVVLQCCVVLCNVM